ncbi:MAG: PAS domain S-box protein [Mucilaginibacter sp.]
MSKNMQPQSASDTQGEQEIKYRVPFYINTLPMIIWDFETKNIIDVNETAIETYGYSKEEFLKMTTREIRPEEDIALLESVTKDEESYGNVHKRLWRHRKKNGAIMFVEVSGYVVTIDGRRVVITHNYDVTEKIAAENKLKESEARYRLLFNKSPMPMLIYDRLTYKILEVNDVAVKNYGYSREEFLTMTIHDYRPKEDVSIVREVIENLDGKDEVRHFGVYNHIKKDGTIIKADVSAYRLNYRDKDCVMVIFIDVTEREAALQRIEENKKALLESRHRLALIYNNIKEIIFLLEVEDGPKYKFSSVNQSFLDSLGLQEEDIIGKSVDALIPEPSLSLATGKYLEAIKTKSKVQWEETTLYPTGRKTGIVTVSPVFNADGVCTQLIGSVYDITAQRQEEQQLRLLESVITNTKDTVMITEAEPFDGPGPRILYVNEAFTKMTGYTADEVIGKTPRMLQGPNSDKEALGKLGAALRRWESYEVTTINYKKNGEEFWVNFSVTPVADETGWYTHWIAIERDVTEEKEAEQKLRASYNERNAILESIGDGFFAIDNNWVITYWNKMAETIMGKKREDLVGRDIREIYPNVPGRITYLYYEKAFRTKERQNFNVHNTEVDRWFDVSVFPSTTGLSVYFKDISETLKHTSTIEEQNKKLREIAWMQSHLTRAPVANILGLMNLLKDAKLNEDEKGDVLKYLLKAAEDLDDVIINIINQTDDFNA